MSGTIKKFRVPAALKADWMSTDEASAELGLAVATLYKKIAAGLFETQRYGRQTLISRDSIQRYLNQFRHVIRKQYNGDGRCGISLVS